MLDVSWVFVRGLLGSAAVVTTMVVLVAGCGQKPAPTVQPQLSAGQAIDLAALASRHVTSVGMTETMTMHLPSSALGGLAGMAGSGASGGAMSFAMTMQMQLKPTLRAEMRMHGSFASHHVAFEEILTGRTIYMRLPGVKPTSRAKPWIEVKLTSLPSGMNLLKLAQKMAGNPVAANPLGEASLLRAAKNLKTVGNRVVDGVPTTEYSGTLSFSALAAFLPGSSRQSLGSTPAALLSAGLSFQVWIDGQHQLRRLALGFGYHGVSVTITSTVTSINQPVRIVPPPRGKIAAVHQA